MPLLKKFVEIWNIAHINHDCNIEMNTRYAIKKDVVHQTTSLTSTIIQIQRYSGHRETFYSISC